MIPRSKAYAPARRCARGCSATGWNPGLRNTIFWLAQPNIKRNGERNRSSAWAFGQLLGVPACWFFTICPLLLTLPGNTFAGSFLSLCLHGESKRTREKQAALLPPQQTGPMAVSFAGSFVGAFPVPIRALRWGLSDDTWRRIMFGVPGMAHRVGAIFGNVGRRSVRF